MTTTIVNSAAQLTTALNKAHAGDTIELASGTYGALTINNYHFTSAVTITSANLSSVAVINGLKVCGDSGLNFSNIVLSSASSPDPYYAFRVASSQNISFSHITAQGNLAEAATHQINGFYISASSNISISNSSFTDLCSGIVANNDSHLTINADSFTQMNKGGVEAGADSYLTVSNCNFSDFQTAGGTHGDCIQIYTSGLSTGSSNVVITGNLLDRGSGVAAQGILIQDENGNTPNANVTINDNTIIGMQWNSIFLNHAVGVVQIENNYIESFSGRDVMSGGTTNFNGWIRVNALSGALLTEIGNHSQAYLLGQNTVAAPAGNFSLGATTDSGLSALATWGSSHSAELGLLPTTLLTTMGYHGIASLVGAM